MILEILLAAMPALLSGPATSREAVRPATPSQGSGSSPEVRSKLDANSAIGAPVKAWPPKKPRRERVADKKFWLLVGTLAAGNIADGITTAQMRDRGGIESGNAWMIGRHPADHKIALGGVVMFGAEVMLTKWMKGHPNKWVRRFWWVPGIYQVEEHTRLAVHNARIYSGGRP